jgi:hypothetical protein
MEATRGLEEAMKREVQNHAEVIKKLHWRRRRMWQQPMSSGADCVGQGSAGAVLSSRDRFDEKAASVAGMGEEMNDVN